MNNSVSHAWLYIYIYICVCVCVCIVRFIYVRSNVKKNILNLFSLSFYIPNHICMFIWLHSLVNLHISDLIYFLMLSFFFFLFLLKPKILIVWGKNTCQCNKPKISSHAEKDIFFFRMRQNRMTDQGLMVGFTDKGLPSWLLSGACDCIG